ncbi:MAG: cytochrome c oxidase subunit II [Luteitalea sp.]|nr:cytochrome c oxidase subunit II [Luteitalea sp.]
MLVVVLVSTLTGCHARPLSALDAAGRDAEEIARLFWWMTGAAAIIWVAVISLTMYCARGPRVQNAQRFTPLLIVGGGVALPAVVLTALLALGLPSLPRLVDAPWTGHLSIAVSGEQWWWRVRYLTPAGGDIDLANEIRLPIGERVDVSLTSDNVIHSFWIPAISGKVDMIPGRTTHLSLEPTRTGTFRGTCAEYCGTSHALMAFPVVVLEHDAFDRWLAEQSQPAQAPATSQAARGGELFLENGCGACHTIRGTPAAGVIGPDLTHVGSRMSLAAATLPNEMAHMVNWIAEPERAKPAAHMPAFGMLGAEQLHALAAYLIGLR